MLSDLKIKNSGFTLIEFLVAIAVATILMTALVIQQSKWNDHLTVSTQAYELALMIRQAQIYSLGVREYAGGAGDKFDIGYGVHISRTGTESNQYIFFADANHNNRYDSGEMVESKNFTRNVKVVKICSGSPSDCNPSSFKQLDVTFFRPQPAPSFALLNEGTILPFTSPAYIKVNKEDESGQEVIIKIEANGQISVQ